MHNFSTASRLAMLIGLLLLSFNSNALANSVTLPSEQDITLESYGKPSASKQVLWFHSEHGISDQLRKMLSMIGESQAIQIHLADWLDSYFIEPSRSSLEKIPPQDVEDFIQHYANQISSHANKKLFIVANGRSASLVLTALHHLQTKGEIPVAGIVLLAPYLQKQTPNIGQQAEYLSIAAYSNLPLYVFQAERSPRFIPLKQLIKTLEKGGSPIFTHVLMNIVGGFQARNPADLRPKDWRAREAFPQQLASALKLLAQTEKAPLKPLANYEKNQRIKKLSRLRPVSIKTPPLTLKDTQGNTHNITDYKGKITLVSFWASWCKPCIEEMPSLVKLKQKYQNQLEILAVNIREDKATIERFTAEMAINFPLVQDLSSHSVEDWKVYVYPSNFILDKTGKLRYAATGAMDWQNKEIESLLESLLQEQ